MSPTRPVNKQNSQLGRKPTSHPLVEAVLDPNGLASQGILLLTGYLGPSPKSGHSRLYRDLSFATFSDIPDTGIVGAFRESPEDEFSLNCLYVKADSIIFTNSDDPINEMEQGPPKSAEILQALKSPTSPERHRQSICIAESVLFDESEIDELAAYLNKYINSKINSENKDEIVAVASALRKVIAVLPVTELPRCAEWLKAEKQTPPPLEMEVVKMITRKLQAALPEETSQLRVLNPLLIDLIQDYLNPRTLYKRYFGVTTGQAFLALALLRHEGFPHIVERLQRLTVRWFRTSLRRQARVIQLDLAARFTETRSREAITHMGPPLSDGGDSRQVDCVGSLPLTADEVQEIRMFIDELEQE